MSSPTIVRWLIRYAIAKAIANVLTGRQPIHTLGLVDSFLKDVWNSQSLEGQLYADPFFWHGSILEADGNVLFIDGTRLR